jgi:hypothetical protein
MYVHISIAYHRRVVGLLISIPHPSDQRGGGWRIQNVALKHPRTIRQGMVRFDLASLDGDPEGSGTDTERVSSFLQVHPPFGLASISIVTRIVMRRAKRDDPFSRPAIATTREEPIAIHHFGEQIIRTDVRQHTDRLDDVLRGLCAVLPPSSSRQSQLGMDPAFPVNDEHDFTGVGIDIDFVD